MYVCMYTEQKKSEAELQSKESNFNFEKAIAIAIAIAMAMASFLTGNPLFPPLNKHHPPKTSHPLVPHLSCCSSMHKEDRDPKRDRKELPLERLALVAVAAGILALGSPNDDAMAAKSGGRVGGQAFRSAAPRSSGPRINNSRTNIYINPPVAPPLVGGYGYGVYGGWGWSPFTFFAPGPSVAVGYGGGFEFFFAILAFGAIAAVVRRFRGSRRNDDEDEDY